MSQVSYEEIYLKAKSGRSTGDPNIWDHVLQYVSLHPNELFHIVSPRKWSIGHQIVYHGNLKLLKTLLNLYNDQNPINIQSKTVPDSESKTILDIAYERRERFQEQYTYIKHLFDQDKFIQACRTQDWITIDNMLEIDPSLLNEKPPYSSNYFIHYLVLLNDVRKFADYAARNNPFQLNLKNADGKTALDLARELHYDDYIEEILALLPSDERERDAMEDRAEDNRSRPETRRPPPPPPPPSNASSNMSRPIELSPHILRNLTCPLTQQIYVDPVKATDGKTYERNAIKRWIREHHISPVTGEPMDETLNDDKVVKDLIIQYRQKRLLL